MKTFLKGWEKVTDRNQEDLTVNYPMGWQCRNGALLQIQKLAGKLRRDIQRGMHAKTRQERRAELWWMPGKFQPEESAGSAERVR